MIRAKWCRWLGVACWWLACGQRSIELESGAPGAASTLSEAAEQCDESTVYRCLGADFQRCTRVRTGTVWVTLDSCGSAALCGPIGGCLAPACEPNEGACLGPVVRRCNSDLTGFNETEFCPNAAYCDPDGCRSTPCEVGERRCNGTRIEQCNSDRNGWDLVQRCEMGCDRALTQCSLVECELSTLRCNGNILELCSAFASESPTISWVALQNCGSPELCQTSDTVSGCVLPD